MVRLGSIVEWLTGGAVTLELGGGDVGRATVAAAPGDDSPPLPGDLVIALRLPGLGRLVVVATLSPAPSWLAEPGDRRLYSRTAAGAPSAWAWLRSAGGAELANAAGGLELAADGTVTINGVTISPAGAIVTPSTVTASDVEVAGVGLAAHVHGVTALGSPTGPPTGPPAP